MGRKYKFTLDEKVAASIDYLEGKKSTAKLASELGVDPKLIKTWADKYRKYGPDAFKTRKSNRSYSAELKNLVVQEYLAGGTSYEILALKYDVPSSTTIRCWVARYNNRLENKDYNPKPEVYMAPRRKTTQEERIEIVNYCLAHNKNYKETAAKFACSYAQVRDWTIKFIQGGPDALKDGRGRRKVEEELTTEQKKDKIIADLMRRNQYLEMENELLKKADEWERRVIGRWPKPNKPDDREN